MGFYERYEKICVLRGLQPCSRRAAELFNVTRATISACKRNANAPKGETVALIAEMLGVKSGLGWYMTWQTGWASYDKSFAALFVICLIFTLVTKGLERIKRYLLRWQNGAVK